MSSITVVEFEKALKSLDEALHLYDQAKTDLEKKAFRDASIQRFEFSIELSWKTAMKVLGSNTLAAKNAIREMARNDLIDNPEEWIQFIDGRNETSHSYDEDVALRVFQLIRRFLPHGQKLLVQLKKSAT